MKRLLCAAIVLLAIGTSYAQQKTPSKPGTSATPPRAKTAAASEAGKIADIRKLLVLTGSREMVNQVKVTLVEQFRQSSPDLPPEMFKEMVAEMKAEDLEEAIIPIYLKHFTASDIKQLIAFYQSPFGRKVTRAMPEIIQESNLIGMNWGQNVVNKVATKWHDAGKLTDREYEQLMGAEEHPH